MSLDLLQTATITPYAWKTSKDLLTRLFKVADEDWLMGVICLEGNSLCILLVFIDLDIFPYSAFLPKRVFYPVTWGPICTQLKGFSQLCMFEARQIYYDRFDLWNLISTHCLTWTFWPDLSCFWTLTHCPTSDSYNCWKMKLVYIKIKWKIEHVHALSSLEV